MDSNLQNGSLGARSHLGGTTKNSPPLQWRDWCRKPGSAPRGRLNRWQYRCGCADVNDSGTSFSMTIRAQFELRIDSKMGNHSPAPPPIRDPHFLRMWKIGHQPRIKAVIVGDTTYGISLLTGTISGSKFAIPDDEFCLTGNEAGFGRERVRKTAKASGQR